MLNSQMVKIWTITQIMDLRTKLNLGTILETVGRAKIQQLEEFYDLFNLDDVSLEDVQIDGTDLSHIVSHNPKQFKLTQHAQPEETLNGD